MRILQAGAPRLLLAALSVALALVVHLRMDDWSAGWSVTLFALGAAGLALSTVGIRQSGPVDGDLAPTPSQSLTERATLSRELIAASGAFALTPVMLAVSLRLFAGDPPYTAAWWLYGSLMVVLLLTLLALEGGWSGLATRVRERRLVTISPAGAVQWSGLGLILLLALFLRTYDLSELPAGLWFDEADNLYHGVEIADDPGSTPVFAPTTNLPSLFLMPIAVVADVAGVSITTARVVSVAFGLAGVVAMFLLARAVLGPMLGLVAALLLATMRWHINWSRIGMHGITLPLFACLTAFTTLRALRSGRYSDYGFAGAVLGLGQWFYTPYRFFVLVLAVMFLHHLILKRPNIRRFAGQLALMAFVAVAVASPVIQYAALEPDVFFARARVTSVFSLEPFGDAVSTVWDGVGEHLKMFSGSGDPNPRHNIPGEPMLDIISGTLFLLGIGLAFARWRNTVLAMLPFWIVIMVLPGALTLPWEWPQSLRGIGAIPAVVLAMTIAIGALWSVMRAAHWTVAWMAPAVLVSAIGGIAYLNVDTYFGRQASHPAVYAGFSTDETLVYRDMVEQQERDYTALVSRQFIYSITALLLADNPPREVIRPPADIPVDPARVTEGVAIYLEPREASVFRLLREYYPDGDFQEIRAPAGGPPLLYKAVIGRDELIASQGLEARYTLSDGSELSTVQTATSADWSTVLPGVNAPFEFVWEGALHIETPGVYTFRLEDGVTTTVILDGRRLLGAGLDHVAIVPAVGLHNLRVRGRVLDTSRAFRLLWQPPNDVETVIGPSNLFHGPIRPLGLAGRFYLPGSSSGVPDAMHVTHAMDIFYYDPVLPEPYIAEWEGTLNVPEAGIYRFGVNGFGTLRLFIDGKAVAYDPPGAGVIRIGGLDLQAGSHAIRAEYRPSRPPSQFAVLWEPPGKDPEPIPIDALEPAWDLMYWVVDPE